MPAEIVVVHVFGVGDAGGNPAPIMLDAEGVPDAQMQAIAREYGHESAFVVSVADQDADVRLRFWVPNHEMEMCGHATVGAVWLLDRLGRTPGDTLTVATASGPVQARILTVDGHRRAEISQPAGWCAAVADPAAVADVCAVLGVPAADLAGPVRNAATSRVKTLVPLPDVATLDGLRPDFERVEGVCDRLGSTGLYPFAVRDRSRREFAARQFPRSSGYPEDAATGVAAAALAFGLLLDGTVGADDRPLTVRQGWAMGSPSEITVRFRVRDEAAAGCWLGGQVRLPAA